MMPHFLVCFLVLMNDSCDRLQSKADGLHRLRFISFYVYRCMLGKITIKKIT